MKRRHLGPGGLGRALMIAALLVLTVGIASHDGVAAQAGRTVDARDFPTLQAAVDSVRSTGGAVYIPAGVYSLPEKLRLYSNTGIFGDGMDRTVLRLADGVVDHLVSNNSTSTTSSNITIRDLTLLGPGTHVGGSNCCIGLRFINVLNSTVVNVASDNFSMDGFYFGYYRQSGVDGVRLSGCRARGNGRNGLALTHGSGNVIDGCRFEGNNRNEAVAGLDFEPDEGLSVSDNKVVGNIATGQNVGIQLFRPYRDYADLAENAICGNQALGNVSAGIYDLKGENNIYVGNYTAGNGTDFLVDPSARIGPEYAGACQLPALPPPPPPPAPPICAPRPRVAVATSAVDAGRIRVDVSATTNPGGVANRVRALRLVDLTNAVVDVEGQTYATSGSVVAFPSSPRQVMFFVRRAGPGPVTVRFVVQDGCGDWPTFVGLGAGAS